jgi:hypothetical protein
LQRLIRLLVLSRKRDIESIQSLTLALLLLVCAALASQSETLETLGAGQGLQLGPSLDTGLRFSLNATALQSTSFRSLSANQTITIKKVDWANNRSVSSS